MTEPQANAPPTRLRVLVVDDQAMVRLVVRHSLAAASDVEVVGEAADGAEALTLAAVLRPDVVVLDLQMPGVTGLAVARELATVSPGSRIVVLTGSEGTDDLAEAYAAGANGYLLKGAAVADVAAAVRAAAAGSESAGSRSRTLPPPV